MGSFRRGTEGCTAGARQQERHPAGCGYRTERSSGRHLQAGSCHRAEAESGTGRGGQGCSERDHQQGRRHQPGSLHRRLRQRSARRAEEGP